MRAAFFLLFGSAALVSSFAISANAQATNKPDLVEAEGASVRDCRPPADAKEAQVLAFDSTKLEAKLAVRLDKGEFKVVTVRVWDRPQDARPLVPVIEAARITQGKLQFYTPNLSADPEPVHDKQFLLAAVLGGAQVCWASETALFKPGPAPRATPVAEIEPRQREPASEARTSETRGRRR